MTASPRPTVLITGAGSGIGLATVLRFAHEGAQVFAGVRDPHAPRLRAALAEAGVSATVLPLDVTDAAARRAAVATVCDAAGGVDVLVNNAGIGGRGPVEAIDPRTLESVFGTNFFAAVALCQLVLPGMRTAGAGIIVNVSSVDARLRGVPLLWPYQASKHALSVMSEALALEVAPFGVRVRLIEPGFFATRIGANRIAREDAAAPAWRAEGSPYAATVAAADRYLAAGSGAAGDPDDVAAAIVAACADPAPFPITMPVGADAHEHHRTRVGVPELDDVTHWIDHAAGGEAEQ